MRSLWIAVAPVVAAVLGIGASGCADRPGHDAGERLTIAAAANLTEAFREVGTAFTAVSGIQVVFSFGATAHLARQIDNSAPFDVFAAADTEHVDDLIAKGKVSAQSRAVYARGQLAVWFPKGDGQSLNDLAGPGVRFLSIANPSLAPYGQAAVESLKSLGLWNRVRAKVVYASSISMAKQHAATGNAEATITAYSLVRNERGRVSKIDAKLHRPLLQAVGVVSASQRPRQAAEFRDFLLGPSGREILARYGYSVDGLAPAEHN